MEDVLRTSPEDIVRLVAELRASRPAYEDFLDFFEKIFLLQESTAQDERLQETSLESPDRKARQQAGLPLLDRGGFPLNPVSVRTRLDTLCGYADTANATLRQAAARIRDHLTEAPGDLDAWISTVRDEKWHALSEAAGILGIDPGLLFFFVYHSMLPEVLKTARAIGPSLGNESRPLGTCPVCGDLPALSFLDADGRRHLVCSFCRHPWPTPRMFCPTCARETVREFDYFGPEDEPEYRVYTCDNCRTALTTVDTRLINRPFYPPAELVITQHLDMTARQQGYIPAADRTGYPGGVD